MKRLGVFLHTSLDGFVAGPKREMDWITVDAEIFDYTATLTDDADTYLMGRTTYEMMEAYWPKAGEQPNASKHDVKHSKWYNGVHKVVISKSLHEQNLPNTTIIGKNLEQEVLDLKKLPGGGIIMFGSPT